MKQILIRVNKSLMIMGLLTTIIYVISLIFVSWALLSAEDKNFMFQSYAFIGVGIIGFFLWISNWPQWFASIILDENSITTKCGLKKHSEPYSKYHHVYIADYYHYGFRPCFIVISKNKVAKDSLSHINMVPVDENIIKIRYSKKRSGKRALTTAFPIKPKLEKAKP